MWLAFLVISDSRKVRKKRYIVITCKLQVKIGEKVRAQLAIKMGEEMCEGVVASFSKIGKDRTDGYKSPRT